ncbi:hypothetical protein U9M48_025683 [Paspalum notatum var. saurae]|uniref:non-specific serine/threonine protein kinase n=1 Tax=Paspalum notatum var. saurae TaxID=547442 RepID=A0AAQ3TVH5_PASNO
MNLGAFIQKMPLDVGQFSTFQSSSFDGNPKLCGSMLGRRCGLADAAPINNNFNSDTDLHDIKVIFAVAFGVFVGVGVLYDQIFQKEAMQLNHFSYKNCRSRIAKAIPSLGLAVLLLISLATPVSSCTELEKTSLLQFLAGLSQDAGLAKLWQEGTDCCKWEGIACNTNGTVSTVSLASRGLEGLISPSLANLTGLEHLNLSYNSLSGGPPKELVSSRSIVVLNISSNMFTGQFTSTLWKGMEYLIALNASNNSITGQIPTHFCNISPLFAVLELSYNIISGRIPPGLGNCSKLRVLKADHNNLTGSLPDELFSITSLECLSVSNNGLQGILDETHIVKLSNLTILDLGGNEFSGNIPDSIGQLKRLQKLRLNYNSMSGELPSTLSNCTNLITIDLKSNSFSGELAKVNFSKFPNLKTLDLMWNNFSGTIPESIYSCINLAALRLSDNNFYGQLSEGLGNLKSLSFLSITNNSISNISSALQALRSLKNLTTVLFGFNFMNEIMPDDVRFDGFENLQVLQINNCLLSGKLPLWISKLANLEILLLNGNQLSGPIPTWLNTLNYLFSLDISSNSLTGEIPTALMNMPMLTSERTTAHLDPGVFVLPVYATPAQQYLIPIAFPKVLNLSNNKFTGEIPQEIGQLKALILLDISFNNLSGPIPQSICNLTNLEVLDLSSNSLTGEIPAALENLNFLSLFNVSNNNLEGPIPTGGQFSTFQNSSFDGNPKLCGSMLGRRCGLADAAPVNNNFNSDTDLHDVKVIFAVAFCIFVGVGVLYDQIEAMQSLHFSYKKNHNRSHIPPIGLVLALLVSFVSCTSSCKDLERTSLLQFLTGLSQDAGLTKLWQSTDCCKWQGITCNQNGTVAAVSLPYRGLEGRISQSLGNLTNLQHLNLSYNSLSGGLPLGLVSSSSIIVLDVSFNLLSGDLHELPSSTSGQPLQVLNISSNLFTGQFTSTTWKGMHNLIALNASNNSFTGQIPSHFCNISPSLAVLELCYNKISGSIPPGLGNCSAIRVLKAGHNNLSGTLPNELFNATSLEYLSFYSNGLHGTLDGTRIAKLTNLIVLDLGENKFSGKIPDSIGQLKILQELHLDFNSMYGELPSTLSNCTDLIVINLMNNGFTGELAKVNFSNLENLETLDLSWNNFSGAIPESIYSCIKLTALRLSYNNFNGQLSNGIGNLKSLSFLSLVNNSLTNITNAIHVLKGSKKLTTLLIGLNFMNETMPNEDNIDGFENLQFLAIEECQLSGTIPLWISKLTNLDILLLDGNRLSGPVPTWINTLHYLFCLDISNNSLSGEIPTTLMNMPMLTSENTTVHLDPMDFDLPVYDGPSRQYRIPVAFPKMLDLSSNHFKGVIPPEIGQLKALATLNISFNNLTGQIPPSICNLTDLEVLDLSSNSLTGEIPAALENLHYLSSFNISNNNMEGPIPTGGQFSTFQNSSFDGNPKLCGPMLIRRCSSADAPLTTKGRDKKAIFAIAFGVFFSVIAILLLLWRLLVSIRVSSLTDQSRREDNGDFERTSFNSISEHELIMMPQGKGDENMLTFSDIVKATNNFNKDHVIGCGGYGLVYRAELPDGCKLAIKKLNGEMCLMQREFTAEVEALSMAQHDHLVPLWGYGVQGNSRFLIYSFMENGSLDDWLHNRDDDASTFLDWPMRLRIAQGASCGLCYIHNVCKPQIVHRDIKSSNILLDKEFKAYVADFGLSRLILPTKTHVTTELVGTLGYIPPEYGQESVATLRGDIYSFGVVLLELLTGLRPVPVLSTSKELVPWVLEMRSQGRQIEVLDPTLQGTGHEEQMLEMLEVACNCVNHNPSMRPPIMQVMSCLESIGGGL